MWPSKMYDFTAVKIMCGRISETNTIVCLIGLILIVDIYSVTGYNASVCTAFCTSSGLTWFDAEYCTNGEFCCRGTGRDVIKYCCSREGYRIPQHDNPPTTTQKSDCGSSNTALIVPVVVSILVIGCLLGGFAFWFIKRRKAMNQVNGPASSTVVYGGAAAHNAYSGPQNNAPYPPANAPPPPTNYYGGPPNNAPYPPAGAPPPPMNYGTPPPYDSKY